MSFLDEISREPDLLKKIWIPKIFWASDHIVRGMCAIPAGEGKSALFCTEFSEEFGDAPNSVTNSALIFSQC